MAKTKVKEKKVKKSKYDTQLKWVLVLMGIIILVVIAVYIGMQISKKFEYGGIHFQKTMFDKLQVYYGRFQIVDDSGKAIANYNLYLRTDPRQLKDIKINGTIKDLDSTVRISLDRASESQCDGREVLMDLAQLVTGTGKVLEVGFNDKELADEKNKSYFTCENAETTTLMFHASNFTKITQIGKCYDIEFADCRIRDVTERFMMGWIANSKGITI